MAEREQTARACEKFTEVFPLNFKRSLTRKSEEERFFKIMKYVKNADMCDMTIFNSAKTKYYKK